MAYVTKYQFQFDSDNGTQYTIDIKKEGYSGDVIKRSLGRSPQLKRENGDNGICGTSLEIYAECSVDQEFAEFYTTDPFEFKVELSQGSSVIWRGFISPELYSEPDIAPPYDVQIIATDGLGELKMSTWAGIGRATLRDNFQELLAYTGITPNYADLVFVNTIACQSPSIGATSLWSSVYVNLDFMEGETCYDVLGKLLSTFNMSLTLDGCRWLFIRATDVVESSGNVVAHNASGTAVNIPAVAYGTMTSYSWWPIDNLSTTVISATNPNTLTLAYQQYKSFFTNPEFKSTEDATSATGWTVSGTAIWKKMFDGECRPVLGYNTHSGTHSVTQTIQVQQHNEVLRLRLLCRTFYFAEGAGGLWPWELKKKVKVVVSVTNGSTTWYLNEDGTDEGSEWKTSQKRIEWKTESVQTIHGAADLSMDAMQEFVVNVPGIPSSGSMTITIYDDDMDHLGYITLGGIYLTCEVPTGYKDTVTASNVAAREANDRNEIYVGDAPIDNNSVLAVANIFTDSSNGVTSQWRSAQMSSRTFLDLMATDYAMCSVMPRLQMEGQMNVPQNSVVPSVMVEPNGNLVVVTKYEWDLLSDSANMTMITAPAVEI